MKNGLRCSASVPYGYYRSPVDKQQLLVDPVSSKVVVRIFELMANGKNTGEITDILTEEKILVPSAYANEHHKGQGNGKVPKNPYQWNRTTVLDILKRKEYLGHTILKKSVSVNFKTDERRLTTEDEQYFFENTHEPIITQELWDKAQRNRRIVERKRINDDIKASAVFLGLLYCADCDSKLVIKMLENDKTGHIIIAYNCTGYDGKKGRCTAHYINENDLKALLLEYIRLISKRIIEDEDSFVKELKDKWQEKQNAVPKQSKAELKAFSKRYEELDALISGLYENFVAGLLPERQYKSLMKKYDDEQKEVEQKIQELSLQTEQQKIPSIKAERFVNLIKKYKEPTEITRELIDKIVVHKPVGRKPNRTQQVDIYFNFIGRYDLAYTEEELTEKRLQAEKEAREKAEQKEQWKKDYQKAYEAKKKAEKLAENDGHPYPQNKCACCGRLFYPTHPLKQFCSEECYDKAKKERSATYNAKRRTADKLEKRVCKICGKPFQPKNKQETLCSSECKRVNQNLLKRRYYQRKKEKEKSLCKDLSQMKEAVSSTNSSAITTIPA